MSTESNELRDEALNTSTPAFTSALVLNLVIFGAELAIFTIVRPRFRGIYEPRSFIPSEDRRIAQLSKSFYGWPLAVWRADWTQIKHHNGLDAYMFVKYLRMMVRIFVPIWLLSWIVLLPVNSVNTTGGKDGLDQFTFGNVTKRERGRYWAHLLLLYVFTGWMLFNIRKEMSDFVTERQIHLVDPEHSATAQARTVLVTGVPHKFLNERALIRLFSFLPGGVQKVWLNRDLKHMPELYDRRLAASNKLESAETKLISIANKIRRNHETAVRKGKASPEEKNYAGSITKGRADELVPRDQRPTHRISKGKFSLPFTGEKVDSIEWCRKEIEETTRELENGRGLLKAEIAVAKATPEGSASGRNWKDLKYPPLSSAFILFNQQIAAHMAAQVLTHNMPWRMSDKYTEVAPADVVWSNLGLNPYESRVRKLISWAATLGLIIGWAFPVTFVGILTNVTGLCKEYKFLAWMCKLPQVIVGIISGVLPPVGLAILMMLLPIVLRLLAKFEGIPRKTGLELSLMTRYFIFQVVHGFLVITLSSGIVKALPDIANNPGSVPNLLAQNLPGASTFFITYAILQGLAGTAGGFLQIVPLIMHYVKLFVLSSTPRSVYAVHYDLRDVAWGTLFPSITLVSVICIAYSVISPIINGFAAVTFFLFYILHKYMFLYVLDQPASGDTGGLFFPKAIQQTMIGCYIQQVCLAALFLLAGAFEHGILTIVLIAITIIFNLVINDSYGPLLHSLPLTLAHKSFGMPQDPEQESVRIGHDDDEEEQAVDGGRFSAESQRRLNTADDLEMQERANPRTPPSRQQSIRDNEAPYDPNEGTHAEGKHNDEPADFDHPAAVEPQRIVWIPVDELGLGEEEARACQEAGVLAGTDNAVMDAAGHVQVHGHPPGATGNMFSGRG